MTGQTRIFALVAAMFFLAACSSGREEATPGQVADESRRPAKAGAPFTFRYKTIGTPVVGSPVTLDLEIHSVFGATPVEIGYQIADPSALLLHEAQPQSMVAELAANDDFVAERVTVIPQREGRLYLNVSAAVTTEDGRTSVVTAIPIHVGAVDTSPVEHGELETNEDGETTRVLTSE